MLSSMGMTQKTSVNESCLLYSQIKQLKNSSASVIP